MTGWDATGFVAETAAEMNEIRETTETNDGGQNPVGNIRGLVTQLCDGDKRNDSCWSGLRYVAGLVVLITTRLAHAHEGVIANRRHCAVADNSMC